MVVGNNKQYRLSYFGADYSDEVYSGLCKHFNQENKIISLTGIFPKVEFDDFSFIHKPTQNYLNLVNNAQLVDGASTRLICLERLMAQLVNAIPSDARWGVHSALLDWPIVKSVLKTKKPYFYDSLIYKNNMKPYRNIEEVRQFLKRYQFILKNKKVGHKLGFNKSIRALDKSAFDDIDVLITRMGLLERIDLNVLKNKIVIVDSLRPGLLQRLGDADVKQVYTYLPQVKQLEDENRLNFSLIESLIYCDNNKNIGRNIITHWLEKNEVVKKYNKYTTTRSKRFIRKFGFVIHPLSFRDILRHPILKPAEPIISRYKESFEKSLTYLPGMSYGKIKGIESAYDGQLAQGNIYTLFDTPKQMLAQNEDQVYSKLVKLCNKAKEEGCELIGLGAFTKVVGDSGVTVNNRSPIPVTTGNSLSASATLWAARVALEKMNFNGKFKGRGMKHDVKVMVIGATGSIGAAASKLIAFSSTHLKIHARNQSKLEILKKEIDLLNLKCEVEIVVDVNQAIEDCDLVITATSSWGKKLFDILRVKPGCVICDVSRPLNVSKEEVLSRPDVLVVESGEITLPGSNLSLNCDIGTPQGVVYACLAETAILALEGRFESFTISRDVDVEKLRLIYDLCKKHRAKLGKIRGHHGVITDHEIELCREIALSVKACI